jgi:alpha,alpha-trehalose phosphorylase
MKIRATPRRSPAPLPRRAVAPRRDRADRDDLGHTETLFAIGNGYIGMRANPSRGARGPLARHLPQRLPRDLADPPRRGGVRLRQDRPDDRQRARRQADEALRRRRAAAAREADLDSYERVIDFRTGVSNRELVWRTPAGKRVRVSSERMVSLEHRHLAVMTLEVTLLDGTAPDRHLVPAPQPPGRRGRVPRAVGGARRGHRPRQARKFDRRVLQPACNATTTPTTRRRRGRARLPLRQSGMTLACAYRHEVETSCEYEVDTDVGEDLAKTVFTFTPRPARRSASPSTSPTTRRAASRPRSSPTAATAPSPRRQDRGHGLQREQQAWLDEFWAAQRRRDRGRPAAQQAVRWNLFQLAQASARTHEQGIAAKGVTAGGYDGHYFWDTEVYVLPFLAYTNPDAPGSCSGSAGTCSTRPAQRAAELSQRGALYPWRTINGEEASAYYAAGTAQYHINAASPTPSSATSTPPATSSSSPRGCRDPGRDGPPVGGPRLLRRQRRETLPHPRGDRPRRVHHRGQRQPVHERHGPLQPALRGPDGRVLRGEWAPRQYASLCRRTGVTDDEIAGWHRAATRCTCPTTRSSASTPRTTASSSASDGTSRHTRPEKYPLLLHFHPLVIYRHQVLKQADVVLAMYLRGEHFSRSRSAATSTTTTRSPPATRRCRRACSRSSPPRSATTTSPSTTSCSRSTSTSPTPTATRPTASTSPTPAVCGRRWSTGSRHGRQRRALRFAPRLPKEWTSMSFRLHRHGSDLRVTVDRDGCTVQVESGNPVPIRRDDDVTDVEPGGSIRIPRARA